MRFPFLMHRQRLLARRVLIVSLVAAGILYSVHFVRENYHVVIPGKLYRSGQLSYGSFATHAGDNHLRTIINLRGPNPDRGWYKRECKLSRRRRIWHRDLPIDSELPTEEELGQLVEVLKECPKPVLLHCESGIDRTGIAAAIGMLLLDDHATPDQALDQLSLRFGMLPWRKATERKLAFIHAYEHWLELQAVEHSAERFEHWLTSHEAREQLRRLGMSSGE